MLLTFQDAVERLVDYVGGSGSDRLLRDCKPAAIEALRDLAGPTKSNGRGRPPTARLAALHDRLIDRVGRWHTEAHRRVPRGATRRPPQGRGRRPPGSSPG